MSGKFDLILLEKSPFCYRVCPAYFLGKKMVTLDEASFWLRHTDLFPEHKPAKWKIVKDLTKK